MNPALASIAVALMLLLPSGCSPESKDIGSVACPASDETTAPETEPRLDCPPGTSYHEQTEDDRVTLAQCEKPDGTRHGPFATFREDGSIRVSGQFQDGKEHGVWQERLGDKLLGEFGYDHGKPDGWWTTFDPPGIKHEATLYEDGEPVLHLFFDDQGKLKEEFRDP